MDELLSELINMDGAEVTSRKICSRLDQATCLSGEDTVAMGPDVRNI